MIRRTAHPLLLLCLCTSLALGPVAAQTADFPPGEDRIVGLSAGERAPFEGQLFETDTAIRWGFRLQRLRLQLEADVRLEREACAARTQLLDTRLELAHERFAFDTELLRADRARLQLDVQNLAQELSSAGDVPWYSTWTFGLVVGLVSAAALAVGAGYLLTVI